jgi:hypothetical protein
MIAAVLMTAGVGLFGSFTGLVASWILTPTKKDTEQDSELARLCEQVEAIQRHLTGGNGIELPRDRAAVDELAQLAAAWPALPAHVKARILADAAGQHLGAA